MNPAVEVRPIVASDADDLQRCAADDKVAAAWIANTHARVATGTEQTYAILFGDRFAGVVMLRNIDPIQRTASPEYFVASSLWNRGIATIAATKALDMAFRTFATIHASTLVRNTASARVLEKLGFRRTGSQSASPGLSTKFPGETWDDWELGHTEWQGKVKRAT